MTEVLPAILPFDFEELENGLSLFTGLARVVHLDVSDGIFTPTTTWPYGVADQERFARIASEAEGLPNWKDFDFEIHLMVKEPERVAAAWRSAGASRLIAHADAIKEIEQWRTLSSIERGVALDLDTPLELLLPFDGAFEFIHCMSIARVGFQGEEFDEAALDKIRAIKKAYPDKALSVDGGVNRETVASVLDAGADRLVVGSAIIDADDPAAEMRYFRNL